MYGLNHSVYGNLLQPQEIINLSQQVRQKEAPLGLLWSPLPSSINSRIIAASSLLQPSVGIFMWFHSTERLYCNQISFSIFLRPQPSTVAGTQQGSGDRCWETPLCKEGETWRPNPLHSIPAILSQLQAMSLLLETAASHKSFSISRTHFWIRKYLLPFKNPFWRWPQHLPHQFPIPVSTSCFTFKIKMEVQIYSENLCHVVLITNLRQNSNTVFPEKEKVLKLILRKLF